MPITADQLQSHLAYEVHYLVWSAVGFRNARGKDKAAFQESALMNAKQRSCTTGGRSFVTQSAAAGRLLRPH